MRFIKVVLSLIAMTIIASGVFSFVLRFAKAREIGWLDFPQAAAAGCLGAALIPLILFIRSRTAADRLLTVVQVAMLIVTSVAGSLIPLFLGREALLFSLWFIAGGVGVTVAVRLTFRLAQNGVRLTPGEIEDMRTRYAQLVSLETHFMEEARRAVTQDLVDGCRVVAIREMAEYVRVERESLEEHLRMYASIRPPPAFGSDPDHQTVHRGSSDRINTRTSVS
ncbi:MAG TPA: hypothetical protein VN397_04415 [Candidatus Methylomirabilis sp.]|nr:hypothetical protein [Candidatus Methylomirabilis sp.]